MESFGVYYRLHNALVSSGVDEFDNSLGPGYVHVYVYKFDVLKITPKGVWINDYGRRRFVLNSARKKYACPTFEEAKESFRARKQRQLRILRGQITHIESALQKIELMTL